MKKLLLPGILSISCCQFLEAQKIMNLQSNETGMQTTLPIEYTFANVSSSIASASPDLTTASNNTALNSNNNDASKEITGLIKAAWTKGNIAELTSKFIYNKESGALSEGFRNIFEAGSEPAQKDIPGVQKSSMLAFISNPNANNQPDTYKGIYWYPGSNDNGGVHTNSGVLNYWFYLLCMGGNGSNDKAFKYTVSGIGIAKAQAIAYRTATNYLQPSAVYQDARTYSIQSAEELFGKGSNEAIQTINAWDAVGVDSATIKQNVISAYDLPEETADASSCIIANKIEFNQTGNQLSFEINDETSSLRDVAVYNMNEKLIFTNCIKTVQGNNRLQINLPSLVDGTYVLKVDNVHSEIFSVKH